MNIRCYNCQFPFALSREEVYAALEMMREQDLKHYNAQCPRCGKVNKVSEDQLHAWAPEWEPGAKLENKSAPVETEEPQKKTAAKAKKAPKKPPAKKTTKRKGKVRRK